MSKSGILVSGVDLGGVKKQFFPPPAGCVLYAPGYPPGGSTITDYSGNANHGTITGATWVRLPSGLRVLSFGGTNDNVNFGSAASLDNLCIVSPYKFAIECWFNPATNGESGAGRLFDKGKFSAWIGANYFYFQVYVGGLAKQVNSWPGGITFGSWYYGVGLFNGTNVQCCLGNTWHTGAVGGQADDHSANSFLCGDNAASDRCFDGLMTPSIVYNETAPFWSSTAATQAFFAQHYQQERYLFGV